MKRILLLFAGAVALGAALATPAAAADGWARSTSWLRAGPGTSYPAIARVRGGAALDVHGCIRRWTWCDVSTGRERGWFPGSRIALLDDGRRVALPGIAAVLGLGILRFERDAYWRDHYRGRPFYDRAERRPPQLRPPPPRDRTEPPRIERPRADAPRIERPRIERPRPERPRIDRPPAANRRASPPRPQERPCPPGGCR